MAPTDNERILFSNTIMTLVTEKEITPFEAMVYYCEKTGLEIEMAASLITPKLKEMIEEEARTLHLIHKSPKGI